MKKIYIVVLLFLSSLTACNDWLEVTPIYDLDENNAFSSADGFNTALRGLYQKASSSDLYGKNLQWGLLSGMAQTYPDPWDNTVWYGMKFNYTHSYTKNAIEAIWGGLYNVVANANLLINNVKNTTVLDTLQRDRIHGEALGMRAIMQLDVVRLFAPAPTTTGGNEKLVPYHDKFPSEFTVPVSTNETLDLIIRDLKKAAELLAPYDTIANKGLAFSTNWANDDYWYRQKQRGYHFSYMAAVAYLSRAYMYKGDYENALHYARNFYETFIQKSTLRKYPLFVFDPGYGGGQSGYKTYKCISEAIFSLYEPTLTDIMVAYQKSTYGFGLFFGEDTEGLVYNLFGDDLDDMRLNQFETREIESSQLEGTAQLVYSKRFDESEGPYHFERVTMPVIRTSEIYYNMIECYYRAGNETEALRLLNEWRKGKKMSRKIESVMSLYDLQDIIINDARRDWLLEGQTFFMYKRMNRHMIDMYDNVIAVPEEGFTFDIPDSQNL